MPPRHKPRPLFRFPEQAVIICLALLAALAGMACKRAVLPLAQAELRFIKDAHRLVRRGETEPFSGLLLDGAEDALADGGRIPDLSAEIRDGLPRGAVVWYLGNREFLRGELDGAAGEQWLTLMKRGPVFDTGALPGLWNLGNRSPGGVARARVEFDLLSEAGDALFRRERPGNPPPAPDSINYFDTGAVWKGVALTPDNALLFFAGRLTGHYAGGRGKHFEIDYKSVIMDGAGKRQVLGHGKYRKFLYQGEKDSGGAGEKRGDILSEEWQLRDGLITAITGFAKDGRETMRLGFRGCCVDPTAGGFILDDAGAPLAEFHSNGRVRIAQSRFEPDGNGGFRRLADNTAPPRWEGNLNAGTLTFTDGTHSTTRQVYHVKNSVADGPYVELAADDRLLLRGAYRDGRRHGKWTIFPRPGDPAPRRDTIYENGRPVED